MDRLRILLADDSPVFRSLLEKILSADPRFEVVGAAANGRECLEMARALKPQAVVLDVEMPVMNGMDTLGQLKESHPGLEVVMFSSQTQRGAEITLRALEMGAFDFVPKPASKSLQDSLYTIQTELTEKLSHLPSGGKAELGAPRPRPAPEPAPPAATQSPAQAPAVVGVGVSTGGPRALAQLVPLLDPELRTAVLIVQHMPPVFTNTLAERLDRLTPLSVREAVDGEAISGGLVLLAPGGRHLTVQREGGGEAPVRVRLDDGPPVHSCRPSVDILFHSLAQIYGPAALGVIMTGMGSDGSEGCRAIRAGGGRLLAQDRASATVWGMPRRPVEEGLCEAVLDLEGLARRINQLAGGRRHA